MKTVVPAPIDNKPNGRFTHAAEDGEDSDIGCYSVFVCFAYIVAPRAGSVAQCILDST